MFKKSALLVLLLFVAVSMSCIFDIDNFTYPLDKDVSDLASEFIVCLVEEDYNNATAFFNAQMKIAARERILRRAWENTLHKMGPYQGIFEKQVEETDGRVTVNVITSFAEGHLNIKILFDDDNLIAGLWFKPIE